MHAVFVSSYLAVQFPQTPVLSSLLWTLSGRHSTSAYSFCVVTLVCTHPNDGSPADTVVDTVGRGVDRFCRDVSSHLAVNFPYMPVMAPLLSSLVGASGTGSDSLSVKSCVVMSGCAVPTDVCLVVTVVDTIRRGNTSACSCVSSYLAVQFPQTPVMGTLMDTIRQ